MSTPLYNSLNNNQSLTPQVQRLMEFARTVRDPKSEVERLLQSGQMTQEQFNSLQAQARQILPLIKR